MCANYPIWKYKHGAWSRRVKPASGFTLIELLIASAVLALMLLLFSQVITGTTASTQAAKNRMDIASMCRVTFDRLGLDLRGMVHEIETSLVVIKGDGATNVSDSLVMVCNVRTQDRGVASGDLRLGTIAYAIRSMDDLAIGISGAPILCRGNGTITWSTTDKQQINSDTLKALKTAVADVSGTSENMLSFQPLAEGVFRCSISFLLNDGTLTDTPPRDKNIKSISNDANVYPLALSAAASDDASQRYIRALVVGVVALDPRTLKIAAQSGSSLETLAKIFTSPAVGSTAAQKWDIDDKSNADLRAKLSPPAFPAPVLKRIQVYQRYFYVQ
jgi:prepilin-type N-terminal cleavage/methylation domain-containing protein